MTVGPGPGQGGPVRIGHYPQFNNVPSAYEGTFRRVWEEVPSPKNGALNFKYSTYMIPIMPLFGTGESGGYVMPPDPTSGGARDFYTPLIQVMPEPVQAGFFQRIGLLPPVNK
jgi:hypothetical protein